jgi:hypothetical protein
VNSPSPGKELDICNAVLETNKKKVQYKKSAAAATKRAKKSQPKAKAGRQPRAKSVRKETDPVVELEEEEEAEPVDEAIQSTL